MSSSDFRTALGNSDLLFDHASLTTAIQRLGTAIDGRYPDAKQAPVFLTVMNGGLILAGHLALACRTDFVFDYVHATRYRSGTEGAQLQWVATPRTSLRGRQVLLVDDILDEGKTLKEIRQWCLDHGAAEVAIAVLCRKDHDRCVDGIAADFTGVIVPDRYVYGFGMDYQEHGRNLDGIYALR
jgi:hypoxanthine phosphoribosyltransferase